MIYITLSFHNIPSTNTYWVCDYKQKKRIYNQKQKQQSSGPQFQAGLSRCLSRRAEFIVGTVNPPLCRCHSSQTHESHQLTSAQTPFPSQVAALILLAHADVTLICVRSRLQREASRVGPGPWQGRGGISETALQALLPCPRMQAPPPSSRLPTPAKNSQKEETGSVCFRSSIQFSLHPTTQFPNFCGCSLCARHYTYFLHIILILTTTTPVITPILQISKQRHKKIKYLVQSYRNSKWQSRIQVLGLIPLLHPVYVKPFLRPPTLSCLKL